MAARLRQVENSGISSRHEFEPVRLPAGERGVYHPDAVEQSLRDWVTSPPVQALAVASGWEWPRTASTLPLLDTLADLSADWDFRGGRERNFIPGTPAMVNGRQVPDDLVIAAARALGLVDATEVTDRAFSHVVVLSGLVRACVNRTHYTAGLLRGGLKAGSVAVLGAHRKLGGDEPEQARGLGFGELADEADAIVAAARRAFELGEPAVADRSSPVPDPGLAAEFQSAWAHYHWPGVQVVIAPSSAPADRRANTADQLRYWADLADVGSSDDVLVVTTQIYVPFQHMEAVRLLGLERGCGVYSCGVGAANSLFPARAFGGRDYLQEIRSALRSAPLLLRAAIKAAQSPRSPGGQS